MTKRLTFDGDFCEIAQCMEMPCPHNRSCTQRQVWERLKMYEDAIPIDQLEGAAGLLRKVGFDGKET